MKFKFSKPKLKIFGFALLIFVILSIAAFSLPIILKSIIQNQNSQFSATALGQFPVTVNPKNKTITESAVVEVFLRSANSPLQAATGNVFFDTFEWIASSIANTPWYQSLAAVDGGFITIKPGMRKEQVADAFATILRWKKPDIQQFLTPIKDATLPLPEGSFSPGVYFVSMGTTPTTAQALINNRFSRDVLSHYGTTTAAIVPLNQALTVASLIQRETGGNDDMRLISGIIWNRLFTNMNLQLDATLQYAKANAAITTAWWPTVLPADKFRKSLYNTYIHVGLPPTPIASPSVAAIVAALNPVKTSCLFYFHDNFGKIHCSDTYAQHVALLKQYFGKGK